MTAQEITYIDKACIYVIIFIILRQLQNDSRRVVCCVYTCSHDENKS